MYLNCKTFFSYRFGTMGTEALVTLAVQGGATALALTNINNTSDVWDFVDYCLQQGIHPIGGVEIRNNADASAPGNAKMCYLLLARNGHGLQCINRMLTQHLQIGTPFPIRPVGLHDVWIVYPLGVLSPELLTDDELIGVQPVYINKLYGTPVLKYPHKYVIMHPVTFKNKTFYNLHRLLRAIDCNTLLSKLQPTDTAPPHEQWLPPSRLLDAFRQYPNIVTNTLRIMDSCSLDIVFHQDKNKKMFSASIEDDRIFLEKLAQDGLQYRFGKKNKEALQRVKKELKIINDLGFNAYFLIAWDVIRYAQSRGFYYVGRGSGANSIVAYCLQITDVNPIELDLYFERFLNPYRTSPPDFDIDFSWKDRDEVIDYIFKRYGREHVALLGMYDTFQFRATVRELGKVFGLPKSEIDMLANSPERNLSRMLAGDTIHKLILQYGRLMENFPNHLSIHPGGMLISEAPMYQWAAVEMPPKGFGTVQIDMFVAEKIGLYKLDILSQRGLGHIKEAIRLVKENHQQDIDIHDVERFKKDEKVAAQIRNADTIGCFYIESPAMRQLLKKLKCDDYITLTAASSIIRPGVSKSGMMKEYIYRFHNPDKFTYLHPKMQELLEETYGVMVYQEDVIKVAHHFAGLDMGEADILRRAMSGKYRGKKEILRIRDTFFANCKERGYPTDIAMEVWRQIESFSGYSFSKAHSASFAVESYQSLYLKTYYPMEFMVAVINNFGGFYSTELYFNELKKTGALLHAPCVNQSTVLTNIQGIHVFVGLCHIQGLEKMLLETIVLQRHEEGNYGSLHDFMQRTQIGLEQLNTLVRAGALRFTGKSKKELLWEANFLHRHQSSNSREALLRKSVLFCEPLPEFHLPQLTQHPLDDALDELELLGFPLCNPFELAEPIPTDTATCIPAAALHLYVGQTVAVTGYLITAKPVHTVKNEMMYFGTFTDTEGDWLDTVHFPDTARQYPLQGRGFYFMEGTVVVEFGVYNLEVHYLKKLGLKNRASIKVDLLPSKGNSNQQKIMLKE